MTLRILLERKGVNVVAVNDLADTNTLGHLFKYDSVHGKFKGDVKINPDQIEVNGSSIRFYQERSPENLPWGDLDIDVVIESTGLFRDRSSSEKHLQAGAKRVIISASLAGADIMTLFAPA